MEFLPAMKLDWLNGWIPIVAPLIGGVLGALVWNAVF